MKPILKNLSYALGSNVLSTVLSVIITLFLPKWLGTEHYGYFQLYAFYASYIGVLHLGWADGILLRYAGAYYENLDYSRFSAQFRLFLIMMLCFGITISTAGHFLAPTFEKTFVYGAVGIAVSIVLPGTFLQYVLQGTNRIREYAAITLLKKVMYVFVLILIFAWDVHHFAYAIFGVLAGEICALLYGGFQCRKLILASPDPFPLALSETTENIRVGIQLMIANLSGMLIVGIVRQAIEYQWDIVAFGKISLALSVSQLLMVLIQSIALILFPMLRRMDAARLPQVYRLLRMGIMVPLLGMLTLYYPVKILLFAWLPQYSDGLAYLALLFPICIYESKMGLLVVTYMKSLRMETKLLTANAVALCLSIALTVLCVFELNSLDLTVASIVLVLAFRCVYAELMVSRRISVDVHRDICMEIGMTAAFIASNWFVGGISGLIVYVACYGLYLVLKKDDVRFLVGYWKTKIG